MGTDIQQRRRTSRDVAIKQQYEHGYRKGKAWAESGAEHGDLVALCEAYVSCAPYLSPAGETLGGCIDGIERVMNDKGYGRFFDEMSGEYVPTTASVCGFCDAVVSALESA